MFRNKRTILLGLILASGQFADVANANYIVGTPTNLGLPVNSFARDWSPSVRGDGLEMYFESDRPGGEGTYDIWVSTRVGTEDDWGAPTNLGAPINTPDWQNGPCISADGLELYFNDWGLWVVRRATVSDPWGEREKDSLINVNTSNANSAPCLSSDGLSLFLFSFDEKDLYVSTRPTRDDLWSEPVNLGPTVNGVDSAWVNRDPSISADGLVLFFSSLRPGVSGGTDLWMTRRSTIDGPWSEPVNLGPTINSAWWEFQPEISADGRSLLFCSNRDDGHGDHDIWQVSIDPVVDLNSDGIVDALDMCIIVDYWGTDEPLCDIGPTPFGDGVVDVQDLIVIAEHIRRKDFIIVDGFEAYNEIWPGEGGTNLIFFTWMDGFVEPPEVRVNGSTIGNAEVAFEQTMETSIVHEGSQSAPLQYDNTVVAFSEVTAYVANQQPAWPPNSLLIGPDWTKEGVGVLSLWFHGKADNDAEPMYVALNGIAVYHDNANAAQVAEWEEWTIPLQEFADLSVDLTNVNSITIGFGTQGDPTMAGGSGMVLFDDIRLYRPGISDVTLVEDFDSLAVGTNMHDVDGWEGWYGDASAGARVTDAVAYSGTNSLEIVGNRDDLVHNWPQLTTGKWVLSVMQYCPSDKQTTGLVYFSIITEYDSAARTKAWIGELRANFATGKAYYGWNQAIQVDLVYDDWVELRLEVDLDAQEADFYYNNVFLATATRPVPSLVGVNIFPEPSIETVYFDDLRIEAGQ